MTSLHRAAIPCAALLGLTSLAAAQTPSFDLTDVNGSRVYSLSADGRVGAGWTSPSGIGFTWTRAVGVANITDPPGGVSSVYAISGDGSTVGGRRFSQNGGTLHAFTWSGAGTFNDLGTLPGIPRSTVLGLSGDGSVAVGNAEPAQLGGPIRAFYWSGSTGMVGLGTTRPGHTRSVANAVSRDGRIVVGTSDDGATTDAFTWTLAGGFNVLPPLPGSPDGYTFARGTNFDGSIVVGESGQGTRVTLCMWRNGQPVNLGIPSNANGGAVGVNDDGTVVIGGLLTAAVSGAAIWTPTRGSEFLTTYLTDFGITIPVGWSLTAVQAVSGDGKTFGGYATNTLSGQVQGFVATVPSPASSCALVLVGGIGVLRRRRGGQHEPKPCPHMDLPGASTRALPGAFE